MTSGVLGKFGTGNRLLLAIAAPIEFKAVLEGLSQPASILPTPWKVFPVGRWDLLLTCVSKTNAAGAVGMHLDPQKHDAVISLGIAGAYPSAHPLPIGSAVAATTSILADEGIATPTSFKPCASVGFPLAPGDRDDVPAHPGLLELVTPLVDATGPIACVSSCAGTDELATSRSRDLGAVAECMEGAAVGVVAARQGVPFLELRTISNTTGTRERQIWDFPRSLQRLRDLVAAMS